MNTLACRWLLIGCLLGGTAVMMGAFGAHGLPATLAERGFDAAAVEKRLADFETGARYQMYAALFLVGIALAIDRQTTTGFRLAAGSMLVGGVLFAGILYAVALVPTELRGQFGRFAPLGGGLMIVGWLAAAVGSWQAKKMKKIAEVGLRNAE